jgi:outer membrane protein assembly factor BamB
VVWKNLLIFHCDGSDTQYIVALDTRTGEQIWRTDRSGELRDNPELKKAYGTPLITAIDGRDLLLSPAADWLYGYDPATGEELWKLSYGVLGFSIVPRPVVSNGIAFIGTSFMKPELLAVRLGPTAATQPEILWRYGRSVPNMPSPLVVGDAVYLVGDKGIATCLDAATGEVRWTGRLGGSFSSSPLFADGKIYVGNRDGEMFVIRPGGSLDILATNDFGEAIMASPVAVGRALYVRTERALYRIEQ